VAVAAAVVGWSSRNPSEVTSDPSARVRLEVEILSTDQSGPAPSPPAADTNTRLTVLVVSADEELRRYIGECLRTRAALLVLEAPSLDAARLYGTATPIDLLVSDLPDDATAPALGTTRRVRVDVLGPPLSARSLLEAVDQALAG